MTTTMMRSYIWRFKEILEVIWVAWWEWMTTNKKCVTKDALIIKTHWIKAEWATSALSNIQCPYFKHWYLKGKASAREDSAEIYTWHQFMKWKKSECIPSYNDQDGENRMGTTALTKHLTTRDRFGHTWIFIIPLRAIGLSEGQSAVNNAPTLSWHVEEGYEGGRKRKVMGIKNVCLIK